MISPMFRRGAFFAVVVVFVAMMVATSSGAEEGSEEPLEFPPFSAGLRAFSAVSNWFGTVVVSIILARRPRAVSPVSGRDRRPSRRAVTARSVVALGPSEAGPRHGRGQPSEAI